MKRKSLLAALALLVVLGGVRSTVAYFTSRDKVDNVFTVGAVSIRLEEPKWDPSAEHIIKPGASYDKDPTVINTGENDAYVRVHCVVSDYSVLRDAGPAGFEPSAMFGDIGSGWVLVDTQPEADDSLRYVYCYTQVLPAGTSTPPLFSTVTMPGFLDDTSITAMDGELTVTLRADAIQSQSFRDYGEAFAAFDRQAGA